MDKQDVLENVASMSVGASSALGVVNFIQNYAPLLSLLLGLGSLLVAAIFYWRSDRIRQKEYELKLRIFEREQKEKNNNITRI